MKRHAQRLKEVSALYSNSNLYNMEEHLDKVMERLFHKLSAFARTFDSIELFEWMHLFAFDAIGIFTVYICRSLSTMVCANKLLVW